MSLALPPPPFLTTTLARITCTSTHKKNVKKETGIRMIQNGYYWMPLNYTNTTKEKHKIIHEINKNVSDQLMAYTCTNTDSCLFHLVDSALRFALSCIFKKKNGVGRRYTQETWAHHITATGIKILFTRDTIGSKVKRWLNQCRRPSTSLCTLLSASVLWHIELAIWTGERSMKMWRECVRKTHGGRFGAVQWEIVAVETAFCVCARRGVACMWRWRRGGTSVLEMDFS